ncbi:YhdT family protein [Bhargavaea ullalensis]|uniref:Membrane protein YhdT n=1 Tax=Bhargavaea ullalensis TaxID=1265685 RepID=A0ABV2GB31_9BACL|nr:YhdT family protein [Bhargavaea cecembensis]
MENKKETDWRFKVANREALIGCALALANFIWWFGFAYGMGSRPVEEYKYIMGLPDWFFISCVLGFLLITVAVIIVVKFFFTEVPFEEEEEIR